MTSYLVGVFYDVEADTPQQALERVASYSSDLHYMKKQELRRSLGHKPEVQATDVTVQAVLTRTPEGKIATVTEELK